MVLVVHHHSATCCKRGVCTQADMQPTIGKTIRPSDEAQDKSGIMLYNLQDVHNTFRSTSDTSPPRTSEIQTSQPKHGLQLQFR